MVASDVLAGIKLLVCDVDGVLTEGGITYGDGGLELKTFNIKDGLGMKLAAWSHLPVIWLTGRSSEAVTRRAKELDVHLFQGAANKDEGLRAIAAAYGVTLAEIAYIGDDLNDVPALRLAGYPVTVADAVPEVMTMASYITQASGGHGAVREIIEVILRAQNRWDAAMTTYLDRICGGNAPQ